MDDSDDYVGAVINRHLIGILVDDSDDYVGAVINRQKRGMSPYDDEPGVFVQIVSEPREVEW